MLSGAVALLAVAAAGSFLAARNIAPGQEAAAGPDDTAPPFGATPAPGTTPDTTRPFWGLPYRTADEAKPRFDQTINGILVGPTVAEYDGSRFCPSRDGKLVSLADAAGPGAIRPSYLPPGAVLEDFLDRSHAIICEGTVLAAQADYVIPAEPDVLGRIERGEVNWFAARHGGSFTILSKRVEYPAFKSNLAADRWQGITVKARPAVLGREIIEPGFGPSALIVADGEYQLTIRGTEITGSELIKIAEGILK